MRMVPLGTGFQADEIKLMRSALDEAAIILCKPSTHIMHGGLIVRETRDIRHE